MGIFSPTSPHPSTVMVFSNFTSDSEPEEMIAFDIEQGEGMHRLPDSSYTEEDSLFTWTDITGWKRGRGGGEIKWGRGSVFCFSILFLFYSMQNVFTENETR